MTLQCLASCGTSPLRRWQLGTKVGGSEVYPGRTGLWSPPVMGPLRTQSLSCRPRLLLGTVHPLSVVVKG